MFDEVCDLTQAANIYDAQNATDEQISNAVTTITETNTNGMDAEEKELAEKADAIKLKESFNLWTNVIELSLTKKDEYALHTIKLSNKTYLNIRKGEAASRMLGRISHAFKTNAMSEYTTIDTIVCAKGAITILG